MRFSAVELSVAFAAFGGVLAVAVPAFFRNLSASKLSEPIDGLDRMVTNALVYSEGRPQDLSFPPPAPLTPAQVPRGVRVTDPRESWQHLTWLSLHFGFEQPHAFSFAFDSELDPVTQAMRFIATSHGDLDGDGMVSTFEVRGERTAGASSRVLPGMFIDREVE